MTAQKRVENLQKTSVALQVLTEQDIRAAGLSTVGDLGAVVPGMQVGVAGPIPQVYIRGVGDFSSTPITNPAVALNVDGIYVAKPQGTVGGLFDLERIEVLKGPQGTLYGRNASGGAVNFISKRPSLDGYEGYAEVEAGDYRLASVEGAVNVPLAPTVAFRAAAQGTSREGYMNDGSDDDHHHSGRLQVLIKNDSISLLVGAAYAHAGGHGGGFALLNPGAAGASSAWTSNTDARAANYFLGAAATQGLCLPAPFFPGVTYTGACPQSAPYPSPPLPPGLSGPYTSLVTALTQPPQQDITAQRYHGELVAKLGGGLELTVLPAFQKLRSDVLSTAGQLYYNPHDDVSATSVEVRLSNSSPDLKWVVGAYYFGQSDDSNELVSGGLVQNNTPLTTQHTHASAVFGETTFSVASATRLVAGARYTRDKRDIDGTVIAIPPSVAFLPPVPQNPCFVGLPKPCRLESWSGADTFGKFTWKAGIEHDLAADNMLYATVSTGFKAGGFDQSSTAVPGSTAAQEFKPETLTAFEIGSRNRFLSNRLQLNLEAFYWKYKDHQEPYVTIDGQGQIAFDYFNAGDAHQWGVDLDFAFKATDDDTIRVNFEYMDSKYDTFTFNVPANPNGAPFVKGAGNGFTSADPLSPLAATTGCATAPVASGPYSGGVAVDCSGMELTHAPKYSGTIDFTHRFVLGGGGDITARVTGRFAAERWVAADFTPAERVPAYFTENASLTYNNAHQWYVSVWGRNLSNKAIYNTGFQSPFVASFATSTLDPPRTFGARVGVRF